jgi:hypothetical protein
MSRNAFNQCAADVERLEEQRDISREERRDCMAEYSEAMAVIDKARAERRRIQQERMYDQDIKDAYEQVEAFHGGDFVL